MKKKGKKDEGRGGEVTKRGEENERGSWIRVLPVLRHCLLYQYNIIYINTIKE